MLAIDFDAEVGLITCERCGVGQADRQYLPRGGALVVSLVPVNRSVIRVQGEHGEKQDEERPGVFSKAWCEDGICSMRARNKTHLEPWLTLSHTQMCVQCAQCGGDWQDEKNVRATGYAVFTSPSRARHLLMYATQLVKNVRTH